VYSNIFLKAQHFFIIIIFFFFFQANETGGSTQTELEGAKRCFSYLKQAGVTIKVFVSDRHRGIA